MGLCCVGLCCVGIVQGRMKMNVCSLHISFSDLKGNNSGVTFQQSILEMCHL